MLHHMDIPGATEFVGLAPHKKENYASWLPFENSKTSPNNPTYLLSVRRASYLLAV